MGFTPDFVINSSIYNVQVNSNKSHHSASARNVTINNECNHVTQLRIQMYFILDIRSRSLLKSRRISGRLYEIRVHPIQSLHNGSSQSAGRTLNIFCSLTDTTFFNGLWHLISCNSIQDWFIDVWCKCPFWFLTVVGNHNTHRPWCLEGQKMASFICTKSVKVTKNLQC